jgi:putative RNA 2'-phosphotransferase
MAALRAGSRSVPSSQLTRLSRLVALVLRHRPEDVGISLDAGGYADLNELAAALAAQPGWESITPRDLLLLAAADPRRYEVRDGRIRARYGHTVAVREPGEPAVPPEWLYVAVPPAELPAVAEAGLRPAGRQHVHLSATPQAALQVGQRHAPDAVVVVVFARRARAAGIEFRRAGPGLYLSGSIAPEFVLLPAQTGQG